MTPQELAKLYKDAVEAMGLLATIDDEGDVIFKYPTLGSFYISLDAENDPAFVRVVFPNFWPVDKGDEGPALEAINEVNMTNKAVKLYAYNKGGEYRVSASIECFLAKQGEAPDAMLLKNTMERNIQAIQSGVTTFASKIKEGSGV